VGQAQELRKRKPVDILLLRERAKEVNDALDALRAMRQGGFSDAFLDQATLMASSRYFDINAIEEGIEVLSLLTPEYVRRVLPLQMEDDPVLRAVAIRVANALVDAGEVRPVYVLEEHTLVPPRADA